jgi:putative toxin-antitoxin system antitoxin component (TIGR02293 family)
LEANGAEVFIMDKERVIRMLAGCATLPKEITSEVEMLNILNQGLPIEALAEIEHRGIVNEAEMKSFIAARTLARRKSEKRLSPEESDLIARIARMYDFAVEVFGDEQKAHKWLRTSNRALSGHLPLDLLRTDYGARMVESILGRIAHGIYS